MHALGISLMAVGGVTFASVVVYYSRDWSRTGIVYRAHKRILFPVIIVAFIMVTIGAFTLSKVNGFW